MAYNVHIFGTDECILDAQTSSPLDLDDTLRALIDTDGVTWTIGSLLDGIYVADSEEFKAIIHAVTPEARKDIEALIAKMGENTLLVEDWQVDETDMILITGARYEEVEEDDED